MDQTKVKTFADMIRESEHIVFFGGAGVSTESGIPDFRSADGIYQEKFHREFSPEELVSHSCYVRYPEVFFDFYREKLVHLEAEPNECHKALFELEKMGKLSAVVTQNIDGLHQKAGSHKVLELHGSVLRNYCEKCHAFYDAAYVMKASGVPHCQKCNGRVKPDVVLYEEGLDDDVISSSIYEIAHADLLIIGGTSLMVYPAAGLVRYFRGKHLVVINRSETGEDKSADLLVRESIGAFFHEVMKELRNE